ncbi:hypothetical protein LOZ58_003375 [Ophidiomyces ophidiicola]|nr:hypothetical protein LOZ65_000806 [Ophidiomyces ophidiicola]KAI1940586.1 hypothetical protein LOZ66_002182 [Ophidiomyces ophidiicola]KAI1961519.1 hypothetical protein LOZ58_003375 [Ophidiomyces ophidiicola]
MTSITISDQSLECLKDKVVVISGGSSGIGLATVKLLLNIGAKVVNGDISPPPADIPQDESCMFVPVDVTKWKDLCLLFRKTKAKYGRIDHAFCNAGIANRAEYLDDRVDEDGDPLEPTRLTLEVNLMGVINMTRLALWYMKQQETGGSIVITASASSFQTFGLVDYATAKHGVLGFMRALKSHLHPKLPIRINSLAPGWTDTAIVPRAVLESVGFKVQSADVVARCAALVMADESRHGQLIYSINGECSEIEKAMLAANLKIIGAVGDVSEESDVKKLAALKEKAQ